MSIHTLDAVIYKIPHAYYIPNSFSDQCSPDSSNRERVALSRSRSLCFYIVFVNSNLANARHLSFMYVSILLLSILVSTTGYVTGFMSKNACNVKKLKRLRCSGSYLVEVVRIKGALAEGGYDIGTSVLCRDYATR